MAEITHEKLRKILDEARWWSPLYELMLRVGRPYRVGRLQRGLRRGPPQQCFANAGKIALRDDHYQYVEGLAVHREFGIPFHHAWLTVGKTAIDVTLEEPRRYRFLGVPFTREKLRERLTATGYWGLLCPDSLYDMNVFEELSPGTMDEFRRQANDRMAQLAELKGQLRSAEF